MSNQKYNEYLKWVAKYANIDNKIASHYARHSFAVMMASMGVTFPILAKMMGHSNSRVTEEVYAKILATDVKRSYQMVKEKLDE